jgi:hypothetical protein
MAVVVVAVKARSVLLGQAHQDVKTRGNRANLTALKASGCRGEAAPHDPAECLNGTPSCITVRIRIPDDVRQVRDRPTGLQVPERFDHRVTRLILDFRLQCAQQRIDHTLVVAERSKNTRSVLPYVRIATVEHLDREGD